MRKNQYTEAIDMGYRVMKAAEKGKDVLLMIKGKTLVGWAHLELGQTRKAINWFQDAINSTQDSLLLQQYGIVYANLALCYNSLGVKDSAFININKAVRYSRMNENLFSLSNSLAIQAQLLVTSGKASQAEEPLKEVVEIRKKIGDPFTWYLIWHNWPYFMLITVSPKKEFRLVRKELTLPIIINLGLNYCFFTAHFLPTTRQREIWRNMLIHLKR